MEIFDNYKKYKQFEPEYKDWKQSKDLSNAKRLEYLNQNKIDETQKAEDIQRGSVLLHAIDVMDEYSQSKAQDMEVTTEMAVAQASSFIMMLGLGLSTVVSFLPPVAKRISKLTEANPKFGIVMAFVPQAIGMLASIAATVPLASWATKAQVGASRKGRFEAMKTDLQNPSKFSILTPEQAQEVENKAKNIPVDDKMKKSIKKSQGMNMNPFESFKSLKDLFGKDKEYEKQRAEFEDKLKEHASNFDKKLSDKDIENAKKDQQILLNLVEKIDIASQDYSENVELATNIVQAIALAGGGLVGWLSNKALKLLKVSSESNVRKFLPATVGFSIPVILSIYATKIQKQASRVGRFKVKQELLKDPNNFVYVDDKKSESVTDAKVKEAPKKPNMFKFILQASKDTKEYQQYLKSQGLDNKKYQKALEDVKLTPEQLKQAKMLQENTFRTFNKVDEKSQTYSESVEAVGDVVKSPAVLIFELLGMGIGALIGRKNIKNLISSADLSATKGIKAMMPMMIGAMAGVLPIVGLDFYVTKEQKKASRIADMLAIKELNDYKNFVDYDNIDSTEEKSTSCISNTNQSNLLKKFV